MVDWKAVGKHLGYDERQLAEFQSRPVNADILSQAEKLKSKTWVVEIVASHGCNSGHQVGDKLYFDGAGNLLTQKAPGRVCIYALQTAATLIFAGVELLYAGADPNKMRFNRGSCIDVGLACGGWGQVTLELSIEDRS